jgi:hypothetical protein
VRLAGTDPVARKYFEQDHAEALAINCQLAAARDIRIEATAQHVIDLNRFCECAEDGDGYDVPRERMRDLRDVGLVKGGRFGWYTTTEAGQLVREAWNG